MRRVFLALLWCWAARGETRYEIDLAQAASHTLLVTLETECSKAACDFQMPVWNALYQVRDFAQHVTGFEAARPAGHPLAHRLLSPSLWRVEAMPGERVRVTYRYYADTPGPFGCAASRRHVFLNFAQVLLYPVDGLRRSMTVRFKNRPPEWRIALDLPEQEGVFRARHYDELVDAPAELSAFAETEFELQGKRVRLVVDGEPDHYDLARLKTAAEKIASTAAAIMQDAPFPSYTFILHFREGGGGGMEHANSTAIDARAPCHDCDLTGIMAHEFFHLWNVKRIRPQSLEPVDYARGNITPSLWFSEGVTSTYGSYIQLQAGLDNAEAFLRRLAGQITRHERMPARLAQSAEESSIAAWLERYPAYGRPGRSISYYLKGELAGYLLDLAIRHHSGNRRSLDDVMRALNTEYAQQGRFFEDTAAIERLSSRAAGRDLKDFFDRVVRQAKPIEWDQYLGYAGYRLASSETTTPSLGVQMAQGPGQRSAIAEVDPDGPAARAGLRPGDRLVSINGRPIQGNPRESMEALEIKPGAEFSLEVERRGRMLTVSATPEFVRQSRYRIQEKPGATPAEKAVRAGWLRLAPDRTKLQ